MKLLILYFTINKVIWLIDRMDLLLKTQRITTYPFRSHSVVVQPWLPVVRIFQTKSF